MGNSGTPAPVTTPPPNPMPIEDSIQAKSDAAAMIASKSSNASRLANDLNQEEANKEPAITRSQLAKADTFAPQPAVKGPVGPRPGRAPGSKINSSAVVTG